MVFQDYELISTKRVNRSRHNTNVYLTRLFAAFGGYSTFYFAGVFGMASSQLFNNSTAIELANPVFSAGGLKRNAARLGYAFGPALLGAYIGMNVFGDAQEFKNLLSHSISYSSEMREIQKELYD
eukprot:CAMPEP_0176347986 /NCGR_PEP_ID=MMETSP0126-20121128/7510_1 /TAXON_ID=141414 ORGANISM="Strombidinopsis acuminatum, Strain SPMC142" /NCGR_SAMPLE_ID=MMETSP0126 /ASSEMBLY_ACC=CAM_ASM_000229 /LENGTH=124 /DNA_ID=CAMNT_0017696519 /DNA_START=17 /DNA_END=391 /DNA_ORIENTATION=+